MAIARGIATSALMWDETAYGADPAIIAAERLYFRQFQPSGSLARIVDETISGRRGTAPSIVGNKDISGQIVTTLAPQSALRYLRHLIGGPTTTGAAAPYTHAFSLAGALPAGFGLQLDYGSSLTAPGRYLRMRGCRIAKGSFKFASSGFCDASYDVRGADFSLVDVAAADPAPGDFGHTGFSMFSGTVLEGGVAISTMTDISFDWDNDLDDSLFVIGGGGVRGDLPEGFAKISGSATMLFKDVALLNKALNSTVSSLQISLQHGTGLGTAGNEKATFSIPHLKWDVKTPGVEGPKGIKATLNFMAERSGSAELTAGVTVLSARATV